MYANASTIRYLAVLQALWLPGSQTEVAVVTADFVKVYNLSVDAISPQYYFLLPTGKIRDATFVVSDSERHLVLMASSGYIYLQVMDATSSAQNGPFYITNILEMKHADVKVSRILDCVFVVCSYCFLWCFVTLLVRCQKVHLTCKKNCQLSTR